MKEEIPGEWHVISVKEKESLWDRLELSFRAIFIHSTLFILTFAAITLTGIQYFFRVEDSLLFTTFLLAFLGVHEFGHYFAAVVHRVRTTLPYFIPLPILSPIGTMGAVIKIKERIPSTLKLFDVGVSGPIAGFVVSLGVLMYGFITLPPIDYVFSYSGHESLKAYVQMYGTFPDAPLMESDGGVLILGDTLLYTFLSSFFENVPPMWEMYHYPALFAGWLGLFFTALNLMPIGQLDGGHILYALLGFKKHRIVARSFFIVLSIMGGVGFVPMIQEYLISLNPSLGLYVWPVWGLVLYFLLNKAFHNHTNWAIYGGAIALIGTFISLIVLPELIINGFGSWGIWALFIVFIVKIEHPPALIEKELPTGRKVLGWLSMIIFILCISPNPFTIIM